MHCRRFVEPGLSRRDMLLRCGGGFGALALAALFREPAFGAVLGDAPAESVRRRSLVGLEPAGARPPHFPGQGHERHLPVHGRRPVAGGHVRPQAAPRPRAWPADQGQDAADAVQQRRQRAALPLEVPAVRRERHPGQRPVSRTSAGASTTWRSSARWSRTSPSTPTPTTSCTPAAACRAGRAWGLGHLRPGQRVPGPARLRRPERRPDPARRPRLLQQRLPAGGLSGVGLQAGGRAGRRTSRPTEPTPDAPAPQARPAAHARPGRARAHGPPRRAGSGHRQLRAGLPHADGRARADEPRRRVGGDRSGSTASTIPIRRRRSSRANA